MADIKTIYGNSITPPDLENKVNAIANKIPVDKRMSLTLSILNDILFR